MSESLMSVRSVALKRKFRDTATSSTVMELDICVEIVSDPVHVFYLDLFMATNWSSDIS